jgi:hypothetical protein
MQQFVCYRAAILQALITLALRFLSSYRKYSRYRRAMITIKIDQAWNHIFGEIPAPVYRPDDPEPAPLNYGYREEFIRQRMPLQPRKNFRNVQTRQPSSRGCQFNSLLCLPFS